MSIMMIVLVGTQADAKSASPVAQETVQTIRELRAIGLPNFEAGQNGPPARVPGLLRKLNGQLRTLITDTLNDRTRSGGATEQEIIEELRAAGWKEIPSYKWNAYGEISQIRFDMRTGYDPRILVVSTQRWVPCDSNDPDTTIYVFEGRAREWKLVLATDADFDSTGEDAKATSFGVEASLPQKPTAGVLDKPAIRSSYFFGRDSGGTSPATR